MIESLPAIILLISVVRVSALQVTFILDGFYYLFVGRFSVAHLPSRLYTMISFCLLRIHRPIPLCDVPQIEIYTIIVDLLSNLSAYSID